MTLSTVKTRGERLARTFGAALVVLVSAGACASREAGPARAPTSAAHSSTTHVSCGEGALTKHGGALLRRPDGAALWYKVAGPAAAPTIFVLHGGPGYNTFAFEEVMGRRLERSFRMVYLDQRGCGRSDVLPAGAAIGMQATVDDLEALRRELGVPRISLLAHSFGGAVAAAFAARYPTSLDRVVLVETSPWLGDALEHQLAYTAAHASEIFPPEDADRVRSAARGTGTPFERVVATYGERGARRKAIQQAVLFGSDAVRESVESSDVRSGLAGCTRPEAVLALAREGHLARTRADGAERLPVPALLVAGRASQAIGPPNIEAAATAWGAELRWVPGGHFPWVEDPDGFTEIVTGFVARR